MNVSSSFFTTINKGTYFHSLEVFGHLKDGNVFCEGNGVLGRKPLPSLFGLTIIIT